MRRFSILLLALAALCAARGLKGKPGRFDYYVLSLSWSPQYCAGEGANKGGSQIQCAPGKRFGFIAHGLWPQYEKDWPEFCAVGPEPDRILVDKMLDIMPAHGLIRHEWRKHGTCDGGNARQYLDRVRWAYQQVRIPDEYKQPLKHVNIRPEVLKQKIVQANSPAPASSFAVLCDGRFLDEVRVCLDKDLRFRACGRDVRDTCRGNAEIIMQPVR